jgi:chitinase
MTQLFTKNAKLKKAEYNTVNFGIPALKTCPSKDICGKYCYANKGAFIWPQVKAAYEYRYQATRKADFIEVATSTLAKKRATHVRIHDSGDFYNKEYLYKWFEIARNLPSKTFYAYTKRVKLLKDNEALKPSNMVIIYSLGGKEDHLIDQKIDRHSKIFNSLEELLKEGYIDTSDNDSNAIKDNNKVGLVLH